MALRIPGHGVPSYDARGTTGDLFVLVQSAPDTRFEQDGVNLWNREEISVVDAVLGTSLEVPTLDGNLKVTARYATEQRAPAQR